MQSQMLKMIAMN